MFENNAQSNSQGSKSGLGVQGTMLGLRVLSPNTFHSPEIDPESGSITTRTSSMLILPSPRAAIDHKKQNSHPDLGKELESAKPSRYKSSDISYLLQTQFPSLLSCKIKAEAHFSSKLSSQEFEVLKAPLPTVTSEEDLASLLKCWFKLLDKALFFGLLHSIPEIKVSHLDDSKRGRYEVALQQITIDAKNKYGPARSISTLLHEMGHAFLRSYSCHCRECKDNWSEEKGGLGRAGHGPPWVSAMLALESWLAKVVTWKVETGVHMYMLIEKKSAEDFSRASQSIQ
jgi:hypothetical protein